MHLFSKCYPCHVHGGGQHAQFLNVQAPPRAQQAQFLNVSPFVPQQTAQFANVQQRPVQQRPVQQQTLFNNLPSSRSRG